MSYSLGRLPERTYIYIYSMYNQGFICWLYFAHASDKPAVATWRLTREAASGQRVEPHRDLRLCHSTEQTATLNAKTAAQGEDEQKTGPLITVSTKLLLLLASVLPAGQSTSVNDSLCRNVICLHDKLSYQKR